MVKIIVLIFLHENQIKRHLFKIYIIGWLSIKEIRKINLLLTISSINSWKNVFKLTKKWLMLFCKWFYKMSLPETETLLQIDSKCTRW